MKRNDWILIWCWVLFGVLAGPYLISVDDSMLVLAGIAILIALIYFTQRRLVPIIKEKTK